MPQCSDPECPGWDVYNEDDFAEVQACDECNLYATDDDACDVALATLLDGADVPVQWLGFIRGATIASLPLLDHDEGTADAHNHAVALAILAWRHDQDHNEEEMGR